MPLPSPNLDDRNFQQLLEEAIQHIRQQCPAWSDLTPGDPGITLLELFAFLTENLLYRINRIPEKAYVEFLKLLGTELKPPSAARVKLRFTRHNASDTRLEIPKGTRITLEGSGQADAPVFVTEQLLVFQPTDQQVEGYATHGVWVEAELAGISNGMPGFTAQALHLPIPLTATAQQDIKIGVETPEAELDEQAAVITHQGKSYQLWEAIDHFSKAEGKRYVCVLERIAGKITFSPSLHLTAADGLLTATPQPIAAIPALGREIRLWYFSGGGVQGNVRAQQLTVMKDPLPGVTVTNPEAATGGRDQETLANALQRGPQELHALNRAVTARDFEQIALNSSRQVERAKAITSNELWQYAAPGSVEVVLVPFLPRPSQDARVITYDNLQQQQTADALQAVQQHLDARRLIGINCKATWARYKIIRVKARLITQEHENTANARSRLLQRLYERISPLPQGGNREGLPFGGSLHISRIYDVLLADPGIRWVDDVKLIVDEVPINDSTELAADPFQQNTWYTNRQDKLFRSMDNGKGWERIAHFRGETITGIQLHPDRPGLLAVITDLIDQNASRVHFSENCGESWLGSAETITLSEFKINNAVWLMRDNQAILFLATDKGLYELARKTGASPLPLAVGNLPSDQGYYAVTASSQRRGTAYVAVAAKNQQGVYLSAQGGLNNSFTAIGLQNKDTRVLVIQQESTRAFLWAGLYSAGGQDEGCQRTELRPEQGASANWQAFANGWQGGSCYALHSTGKYMLAATHRAGVVTLNTGSPQPVWIASDVNNGLPLRDVGRFHIINAVAASPHEPQWVLAATKEAGIFRSDDFGIHFTAASQQIFVDKVTLPPTWLFCSGEHELELVADI